MLYSRRKRLLPRENGVKQAGGREGIHPAIVEEGRQETAREESEEAALAQVQ